MVSKSSLVNQKLFNLNPSDGKEAKKVIKETNQAIKQAANDLDLVKRLWSSYISLLGLTLSCR